MKLKTIIIKSFSGASFLLIIFLFGFCHLAEADSFSLMHTTPQSILYDSGFSPFISPVNLDKSLPDSSNKNKGTFVLYRLYNDFRYLLGKPDFYLTVGGLELIPNVFTSAFKHESPELTELWGSSTFADNLFEAGETIGDGAFPVVASVTLWGVGKVAGSSRLSEFSSDLFRAQVVNGVFTMALKVSVRRTRPDGTPYSYPSGHTSSVFTTTGVVYKHFGKRWGIPAFIVATYVGLSRLQENKHYLSDVVAGGLLGSYVGLTIARRDHHNGQLIIYPVMNQNSRGIALSMKF